MGLQKRTTATTSSLGLALLATFVLSLAQAPQAAAVPASPKTIVANASQAAATTRISHVKPPVKCYKKGNKTCCRTGNGPLKCTVTKTRSKTKTRSRTSIPSKFTVACHKKGTKLCCKTANSPLQCTSIKTRSRASIPSKFTVTCHKKGTKLCCKRENGPLQCAKVPT